jgi:hypothetical protein
MKMFHVLARGGLLMSRERAHVPSVTEVLDPVRVVTRQHVASRLNILRFVGVDSNNGTALLRFTLVL